MLKLTLDSNICYLWYQFKKKTVLFAFLIQLAMFLLYIFIK